MCGFVWPKTNSTVVFLLTQEFSHFLVLRSGFVLFFTKNSFGIVPGGKKGE